MRGLLAILAVAASLPAAALSLEDFRDPQDGRFDTSRFLLDLNGFLPLPFIITEPAIGYGGATALDFTLPVIQKSGGIQVVPVAIVSGFILSLLGPILILGFLAI